MFIHVVIRCIDIIALLHITTEWQLPEVISNLCGFKELHIDYRFLCYAFFVYILFSINLQVCSVLYLCDFKGS